VVGVTSDFCTILDQELIPYRYSSCSSSCWGSVVSNRIGMKFGRILLQVNVHRLMKMTLLKVLKSITSFYTFNIVVMTSFRAEKCCHLVCAHAASACRPLHAPTAHSNSVHSLSLFVSCTPHSSDLRC